MNSGVRECVRKIREIIGNEKYNDIFKVETGEATYRLLVDCIGELGSAIREGGESLHRMVKVTDGYLLPISEDEWCRVIETGNGCIGFVVYRGREATRFVVDKGLKQCAVQVTEVGVVRGREGVLTRMKAGYKNDSEIQTVLTGI